ncbi:hypothetical protein QQ054_01095 [Oscillatoria amoena NRMC-F 0135]|nr:hypothetical protein [Oscillatoria amoena NRMC-F 0135]
MRPISTGFPVAKYSADSVTVNDLTFNSTALTASGLIGTNTITLSASTGVQIGMYLRLSNAITGETFYVINLVGTTVTLSGNLAAGYAGTPVFFGCVGNLRDLSGNGNNLIQASGSQQPLLIENYQRGHKALYFDGVNDRMEAIFTLKQPYSVYMLVGANVGANQFIWDGYTQQCFARLDNTAISLQINAGGSSSVRADATLIGATKMCVGVFNQTGTIAQINDRLEIGNAGTNNPDGFILFSRCVPNTSNVATGYFFHSEVFPHAHSQATITNQCNTIQSLYAI